MSAKYQFFKNPRSTEQASDGKAPLHARIVGGKTVRFEKLCERIATRSTFKTGEVMGIMSLFREELISALLDGDKLELKGVGTFQATAQCPPIDNPKEIRAESIHFSRILFNASKELKRELSIMRFERASDYRKPDVYTEEERQMRILQYLQSHTCIKSSACMGLNQCSRYVAQNDLKGLYDEGCLSRLGGPRVAVYVLPEQKK